MRKCAKCGARNDEQAVMCSLCNERLGVSHQAESYEPRLWNQGKQTFRGKAADPNATRDEPPGGLPGSGSHALPKKDESATTTRHYLVPPYGEPTLLDTTKPALSFGRDETCDFKLASTKVSRRHAEILFSKADKAYVRDLGSQNGTYLNDEKLTVEKAIEDGDVLRMGDFSVTYRRLAAGEDASKLNVKANETAVMEAVRVEASDDGALTGDISILPVGEVLRRLGSLRAYGVLNIDVTGMKGSIKVADGKPIEGSYAGLEAAPAIAAMSSLTKGHFAFVADAPPPRAAATPAPPAASPTATPQKATAVRPVAAPTTARQPVSPTPPPSAPRKPGQG